jgi:hypothetical protein
MGKYDFRSPGAAAGDAVSKYFEDLAARGRAERAEAERRLLMQDAARRQQMADQRQAEQDRIAAEDRTRRIQTEDRDYTNAQERKRIEDARYAAKQNQKVLDRKDADGQRYLNTERDYFEDEKKRQFDASESAKDRASQERRAARDVRLQIPADSSALR